MRRVPHNLLGVWLIGVWALIGCHVYDPKRIAENAGNAGNGADKDSGSLEDGAPPDGDGGGGADAGPCLVPQDEQCNLIDDDCDGFRDDVDEDTRRVCAAAIPNAAVAECVELRGEARCVLRECMDGFFNCDGIPSNGCEPYCMCHECPDEDAGPGQDPDADGGS